MYFSLHCSDTSLNASKGFFLSSQVSFSHIEYFEYDECIMSIFFVMFLSRGTTNRFHNFFFLSSQYQCCKQMQQQDLFFTKKKIAKKLANLTCFLAPQSHFLQKNSHFCGTKIFRNTVKLPAL